jgi:hypothetical protein
MSLKTDMYVVGGTINNQGTKDVSESAPSANLLDVLFNDDNGGLSIPPDLIYGSNFLTSRVGPDQGDEGLCYKPGCSYDGQSAPDPAVCVGP